MNDDGEPKPSPSNDNHHSSEKKQQLKKENYSVRGRRPRIGFSETFSNIGILDLGGLDIELQHQSELNSSPRTLEPGTPSSRASTSDSEGQHDLRGTNNNQWRQGFFKLLKKGSQMPFHTFHPLKNVPKLTRRKSKRIREDLIPSLSSPALKSSLDSEFCCFKSSWKNFTLSEIQAATNDFSHDNLIGEGGYAEVYLGKLEDGNFVAIKRLTRGSQEEMTADFLSELGIIVHVDHPNIARLIGYGVEGGMFLVLQLSPHGSLSSILYGPREKLNWSLRFKIIMGTAEGLQYLHEGCQRRIIHKDIKASNILLSENFEPQISDFGLSKWLPDQWTHHTVSKVEGTFGYIPPEFFMHGIVDEKTDVYAYGVLLLELITGRQALDSSQKSLVMWAKPLLSANNIKELVDPTLANAYDEVQMKHVILTASLCIEQTSVHRPYMNQVLKILRGEEESLKMMKERQKSKLQRTYSVELNDAEDYNSTKFLSDRDRFMETILGSNSIKKESNES
ncbi:PREDICTED: receptor-like cytosolic serine/threonine-protein kinase RBK2 isoform X1 [Lupinus angustifolius]|uniref:receptor-like cytosolic serine/threonine-protein kinase RBK2 isoform X1 n=1 Tax=Lupinus angustifolius TaxID=3871 RepID=UPI00092F62DE|nr:PREDICTED: receptor-like cytosolic serine/threonine-protein kinase RBK2 isoform X1 [Lupinus angustifolius]